MSYRNDRTEEVLKEHHVTENSLLWNRVMDNESRYTTHVRHNRYGETFVNGYNLETGEYVGDSEFLNMW